MNKLALLRTHLMESPLQIQPDDLLVFADKGKVISESSGTNQDYELHYQGQVIITDYTQETDALLFLVLQWYHQAFPGHPKDGCRFEADILSHEAADVTITLDLEETIGVVQTPDGIQLNHCSDPSMDPILLPAENWTGYVNDDETMNWVNGND